MLKALLTFSLFSLVFCSHGQKKDSIKKIRNTSIVLGASSIIGFSALHQVWYKDYPSNNFHFFDDSKNWLQMDKFGHIYTANKLSQLFYNTYSWTAMTERKSVIIGSSLGLGFQTTIEVMDGFSSAWGFSWSDMTANTIGSLSFLLQQLKWGENKFLLKFSYHTTIYPEIRPEVLGTNFSERILKDYNGQTYWLSFSPNLFIEKIPSWVCLSLGYSIDSKLVGNKEYYYDQSENMEYFSSRQYLLSLDIDFSKLRIKKPWLKKIVNQFNYLKIPFPALMFNSKSTSFKGIYF